MKIISFLIKEIDNVRNSISMGISDFSNFSFRESINKEKLADMESSNNRIGFHDRMIIE